MRKGVRRLLKLGIICAILLPMGIYGGLALMPYLNLLPAMEDPTAMGINNMILVGREYNFTIENQFSISNESVEMNFPVWDIQGIYLTNQYTSPNRTNYFSPKVFISGTSIDLSSNQLPPHNYTNELQKSYTTTKVNTTHHILAVYGVWNTSDHGFPNHYNASAGGSFNGITITLSTPVSQPNTTLWIDYQSDQVPLIIEYYHKNWTYCIFQIDLALTNKYDKEMILPAANFTLNFLADLLGTGWISQDYSIAPKSTVSIPAYLRIKNSRFFETFLTAMLMGYPLDLKANFEAFIRINGLLYNLPFFQITFPTTLNFPLPTSEGGAPPYITFVNRSSVSANQPVTITINASDAGTGISNRTYLRYSIDNGIIWNNVTMTGGLWVNTYLTSFFTNYYPIPSTEGNETYQAQIPGFPAGQTVLFKIYLEDYAGNVDHVKIANWMESEIYTYTVPSSTPLPEFTETLIPVVGSSFFTTFFNYLAAKGLNLDNFLVSQGIDVFPDLTLLTKLGEMSDFFYAHDVDIDYMLGLFFVSFNKAVSIMEDSGVSIGDLISIFGIDFKILGDFLIDSLQLPLNDDLTTLAGEMFQRIVLLDDMDGNVTNWVLDASGTVSGSPSIKLTINGENIGSKSLNWTVTGPENLTYNYGNNIISTAVNNVFSFWINQSNYIALNNYLSINLIDTQNISIQSRVISFTADSDRTWQEISLFLNSTDFTIPTGFNFSTIQKVQISYNGSSIAKIYLDDLGIYSPTAYNAQAYFLYDLKLTNLQINEFLLYSFVDINAEAIIPDIDWIANDNRTSYWNYLSLLATGNDTNSHSTAANMLLAEMGVPNSYNRLVGSVTGQIIPAGAAIMTTDLYPYTSAILTILLYLGLAYVAYQTAKRELKKRRLEVPEQEPEEVISAKPKPFAEPPSKPTTEDWV